MNAYDNFILRPKYRNSVEDIKDAIMTVYASNAYKYNGLYNTTQLKYEPIENYRMTEEGKDVTDIYGNTTNNMGARNVDSMLGARTDSNQYGASQNDNTIQVSPDSSNNWLNKEKNTYNSATHTDTTNLGAQNSTTYQDAYTDETNNTSNTSLAHKLIRSGNIGVTTSQQLLQSEREVVDFSIYLVIAKDIMHQLCLVTQSCEDYYLIDVY